jgi:hypothetical protein
MLLFTVDRLLEVSCAPERCPTFARKVGQRLHIFPLSATSGDGPSEWYNWLHEQGEDIP